MASRFKYLWPVVLSIGCSRVDGGTPSVAPPPVIEPAPPTRDAAPDEPAPIGEFTITFYYVAGEEEHARRQEAARPAAANDNQTLAAVAPVELVPVYEAKHCTPIAEVSREFAVELALQGTGKLRDGRLLNVSGTCACPRSPCFTEVRNTWGISGSGRPLQPFRTVAVDRRVIPLGSLLYVPLLEGRTMPGRPPWGGFVHDGCLVADDTGGAIKGHEIDLFVGRKAWFLGLSGSRTSHAWARNVPVFDGTALCERKGRKVGRKAAAI